MIDIDAEVPALKFAMTKEKLDGPEISVPPILNAELASTGGFAENFCVDRLSPQPKFAVSK